MKEKEKTEGQGLAEKAGPVLKLSKVYEFEGEKIAEVDFSDHVNMTTKNMVRIDRILVTSGNVSIASEGTLAYALVFAAECTGLPVEFFETLTPYDGMRVKNTVGNFLNGAA